MTDKNTLSKAGFVVVMGRPNVGKSTLINAILGQKVAAVSPRPQTTRKRQMGILTLQRQDQVAQAVFVDTPGIHKPHHRLGELMNAEAAQTLEESDLILMVVDASEPPNEEDELLIEIIRKLRKNLTVILALNKIDLVVLSHQADYTDKYTQALPHAKAFKVSAVRGDHLTTLLDAVIEALPEGEPFFPEEQLTDLYERELAADLIRAAALTLLRDEVPHGIAVRIDQYTERNEHGAYIEATLFVERESHKAIVIGKEGNMLKKIGTQARAEIESMSGRKVFLQLKVKVRKNWRDDEKVLCFFGFH